MTMNVFHPDHLQPGNMVGPWRILKSLGAGAMGHVFQVEQGGHTYALKMAVRPAPAEVPAGDEDLDRRMAHEAAFLLSHESTPGVLRVLEVGRWPNALGGYRFFVTEHVEGDTFHEWRWRVCPSAARLLQVFERLVLTVKDLHRRGIHHRDIKSDNVLVRHEDEAPILIDFGVVSLPGAATLTVGVPAGTLHTLPPELLAFVRSEAWKQGARFRGGVPADLYALGVLLYEALTDCHPFDPLLPTPELVAAIEGTLPPAPHELNPGVPRALSTIAMQLLVKDPGARLASAEALHQALWEAKKESRARDWQAPLPLPPQGMGREHRKARENEESSPPRETPGDKVPTEEARPGASQAGERRPAGALFKARTTLALLWALTPRRVRWLVPLGLGLLLSLWLAWVTLAPPSQKGSAPVSTHDSRLSRLLVLLCTTTGLGCPGAQVKPPGPEACPRETYRAMVEMGLTKTERGVKVVVDVKQPPDPEIGEGHRGTYSDGPVIGRVVRGAAGLPPGTLLYGQLWTGPGIIDHDGRESVKGRYMEAHLPDGKRVPVCLAMGNSDGLSYWDPGSKPGAVVLPRVYGVHAVSHWP